MKVRPLMRLGKELSLPKDHHQQVEVHHREEGSSAEQLGSEQAVKEELTMSS